MREYLFRAKFVGSRMALFLLLAVGLNGTFIQGVMGGSVVSVFVGLVWLFVGVSVGLVLYGGYSVSGLFRAYVDGVGRVTGR